MQRLLGPLALAFVVTACEQPGATRETAEQAAAPEQQAMVRVINAVPDQPALDVVAGEAETFSDVRFGAATPYQPVPDDATLRVRSEAAGAAPPAEPARPEAAPAVPGEGEAEGANLAGGKRYTALVAPAGEAGAGLKLRLVEDDPEPPAEGKVKVRLLNAAPDAGDVQLVVSGKEIAGAGERYQDIEATAGPVELRVSAEGQRKEVVPLRDVQLQPGKIHTIVLHGKPGAQLGAIAVEDAPAEGAAPLQPMQPRAPETEPRPPEREP
jgi:hypothetical protein